MDIVCSQESCRERSPCYYPTPVCCPPASGHALDWPADVPAPPAAARSASCSCASICSAGRMACATVL